MANGDLAIFTDYVPKVSAMEPAEPVNVPKPLSWLDRRALEVGLKTMVKPDKPYWSTSMVTAWVAVIGLGIVILGAIGGLYAYTRDSTAKEYYERGRRDERDAARDARIRELETELKIKKKTEEQQP